MLTTLEDLKPGSTLYLSLGISNCHDKPLKGKSGDENEEQVFFLLKINLLLDRVREWSSLCKDT